MMSSNYVCCMFDFPEGTDAEIFAQTIVSNLDCSSRFSHLLEAGKYSKNFLTRIR